MRAGEAVDGGVGGFLLGDVFSCGLAEGGGGFLDVENVVGDLKSPADGFAEAAEAGDVFGGSSGAKSACGDRSASVRPYRRQWPAAHTQPSPCLIQRPGTHAAPI